MNSAYIAIISSIIGLIIATTIILVEQNCIDKFLSFFQSLAEKRKRKERTKEKKIV